jgi:hypothetical protein
VIGPRLIAALILAIVEPIYAIILGRIRTQRHPRRQSP